MIKLKELLSSTSPISRKLRIHLSKEPIEVVRGKSLECAWDKPCGLWYGFGREWIDYVEKEEGLSHKRGNYIYFVGIRDLKRVLQLKDFHDLIQFSKQYSECISVRWNEVARNYSGIEINPHIDVAAAHTEIEEAFEELIWYKNWDVASGCVWDVSIINLKLIYPKIPHD